jgi:hypothetical protein
MDCAMYAGQKKNFLIQISTNMNNQNANLFSLLIGFMAASFLQLTAL